MPVTKTRSNTKSRNKTKADAPANRTSDCGSEISREEYIATAAYYKAQERGFDPDGEIDDWLMAEAEYEVFTRSLCIMFAHGPVLVAACPVAAEEIQQRGAYVS